MTALRTLLRRYRLLALVLAGAALCLRMLVPAGYMVTPLNKVLTIQICADSLDHDAIAKIAVPVKAPTGKAGSAAKGDCAFSSLGMAAAGSADAVQLALALAFILLIGLAPAAAPRPRRLSRLRPPLRGPPRSI